MKFYEKLTLITLWLFFHKVAVGELHCDGYTVQTGKHQILGDSLVSSLQTLTSVKDMLKVILKN